MLFPTFLTTSGRLGSGQVGWPHHASGAVVSGQVASGAVLGAAGGGARTVASGTLGALDFGSGSVVSGSVASGQVGQFHVASGAVTSGRLGVTGSPASGCVLQADFSWVAQTGGTWKRLATATASNSATVDFTLPSGYTAYLLTLSYVSPQTDADVPRIRTSSNGGSSFDSGASDYCWVFTGVNTSAAVGTQADVADNQIVLSTNVGNAAGEELSGRIYIYRPSAAAQIGMDFWVQMKTSAGLFYNRYGSGRRLSAADVDAIRFLFFSGNIASGQFDLYGLSE